MRFFSLLVVVVSTAVTTSAVAHDLHHTVAEGEALVVKLFFADNSAFSYESYEIYRPETKIPFQVGRTDENGMIAFVPDSAGSWRIKVFSEDGHGMDISVETGETGELIRAEKSLFDRYSRILFGLGVIFGLFGVFTLFRRKQ